MSTTTNPTLFGLSLAPLYEALAKVESDNGATSDNVYQLTRVYVEDVNRILGNEVYNPDSPYVFSNPHLQKGMMYAYWAHWGVHYQQKTGNPVTYEILARIHNGGPIGWKKQATLKYWLKVKAAMEGGAK